MPKRDETYMQAQRDAIAQAALKVLIEKGYHETSLRDICRAAGVSNGALYSYFPTREAVILAACAIDHVQNRDMELPSSWQEYAGLPSDDVAVPGSYRSRRFRLSLQFTAEISQMDEMPEGAPALYDVYREWFRRSLEALRNRGIITLPFGIEMTTEMHTQLFTAFEYNRVLTRETRADQMRAAFETSLALTAGLVEGDEVAAATGIGQRVDRKVSAGAERLVPERPEKAVVERDGGRRVGK
jgi:AcrR family transcriptional regulator